MQKNGDISLDYWCPNSSFSFIFSRLHDCTFNNSFSGKRVFTWFENAKPENVEHSHYYVFFFDLLKLSLSWWQKTNQIKKPMQTKYPKLPPCTPCELNLYLSWTLNIQTYVMIWEVSFLLSHYDELSVADKREWLWITTQMGKSQWNGK